MAAKDQLLIRVFEDYNKTAYEDDLTSRWTNLIITTGLHGGFKEAQLSVPMPIEYAWNYVNKERRHGRHYDHLEIKDGTDVIWEGRIMDVTFRMDTRFLGIDLVAMGYWSSARDQYYDADDAGNTNWQTGGPFTVSDIIKELITKECPDISGTANIDATSRDVVGINLTARAYPMDIIIDKLAPLSDNDNSIWYFAVWEDRKPYWKKRAITRPNWTVSSAEIDRLVLTQQGIHLRNYILPVVGTAEKTGSSDADSQRLYPRRELIINLPAGVSDTVANDAGKTALAERKNPSQDQTIRVKGKVYKNVSLTALGAGTTDQNAIQSLPKWWVRAGDSIMVRDLVPDSFGTAKLDDLRTFYILETRYDGVQDILEIRPDRPGGALDVLLARISQLEKNK